MVTHIENPWPDLIYRHPETTLAIWTVINGARIWEPNAEALKGILPEGYQPPPEANMRIERALEIVLARVRMYDALKRELMTELITTRDNRVRRDRYFRRDL